MKNQIKTLLRNDKINKTKKYRKNNNESKKRSIRQFHKIKTKKDQKGGLYHQTCEEGCGINTDTGECIDEENLNVAKPSLEVFSKFMKEVNEIPQLKYGIKLDSDRKCRMYIWHNDDIMPNNHIHIDYNIEKGSLFTITYTYDLGIEPNSQFDGNGNKICDTKYHFILEKNKDDIIGISVDNLWAEYLETKKNNEEVINNMKSKAEKTINQHKQRLLAHALYEEEKRTQEVLEENKKKKDEQRIQKEKESQQKQREELRQAKPESKKNMSKEQIVKIIFEKLNLIETIPEHSKKRVNCEIDRLKKELNLEKRERALIFTTFNDNKGKEKDVDELYREYFNRCLKGKDKLEEPKLMEKEEYLDLFKEKDKEKRKSYYDNFVMEFDKIDAVEEELKRSKIIAEAQQELTGFESDGDEENPETKEEEDLDPIVFDKQLNGIKMKKVKLFNEILGSKNPELSKKNRGDLEGIKDELVELYKVKP